MVFGICWVWAVSQGMAVRAAPLMRSSSSMSLLGKEEVEPGSSGVEEPLRSRFPLLRVEDAGGIEVRGKAFRGL